MAHSDDWTYTPGSTKPKDRIRFLAGDTNTARKLLLDAEIGTALALGGNNVFRGAAYACDAIAGKFARDSTFTVQGTNAERRDAFDHYKKLAKELRQKASGTGSLFAVNDPNQKLGFGGDSSLIPPGIRRGMHDFQRGIRNWWRSASC